MLEKNAKILRDIFLILALLVFLAGVLQIILFAFDMSLGIGLTRRFGFSPHSFAEAAIFFVLTSIAFGIIHSNAPKS
jgi:hypothetical protein